MIDLSAMGINYSISAQYFLHKENLRYTLGTTAPTKNLLLHKWNVHANCTKMEPPILQRNVNCTDGRGFICS